MGFTSYHSGLEAHAQAKRTNQSEKLRSKPGRGSAKRRRRAKAEAMVRAKAGQRSEEGLGALIKSKANGHKLASSVEDAVMAPPVMAISVLSLGCCHGATSMIINAKPQPLEHQSNYGFEKK